MTKYTIYHYGFGLCLLLLFSACGKKSLDKKEYLDWYNSDQNTLIKTKTIDGVGLDMKLKVQDYFLAANDAVTTNATTEDPYWDVDFRMSSVDKSKRIADMLTAKFGQDGEVNMDLWLAFGMKDRIKLYTAIDTVNCTMFHQVRNYDLAPYLDFTIGFPVDKKINKTLFNEGFKIRVDLAEFGMGSQDFEYKASDFDQLPQLEKNK
ncbi:MAG: hypothetical protein JST26_17625 [Bacteroidetes bacterium]|nr:hypothetical protein [Bacteroidota bacterium]